MSELSILQHTLGLDEYGRGTKYRNRFITCQGHSDLETIEKLVSKGLMKEDEPYRNQDIIGGDKCRLFYVTEEGEDYITQNSPKRPKVSRAKQRYLRFLKYGDCFNGFLDYCKWDQTQNWDEAQ